MSTCNFVVIQDGVSTVNPPPANNHVEFAQFDAADANLTLRPVLTFRINPSGGDVTLRILLNNTEIVKPALFTTEATRMWCEVVESSILEATGNEVIAEVTAGPGNVTISDVILWYRQ
jgi:hypothetical protein